MAKRALRLVGSDGAKASARLPEVAVPDAVVEEVATDIATLVRRAELKCAFEVGRIVAERFYGGDHAAWHRKGPKANSLARLAELLHARGVGGAAALHLCLGAFETLTQLGEDSTWNHLTRSHVRAVLALPQPARASLLREAELRGWTVARLEEAAARKPRERRGGRPRTPAFVRGITQAERLFAPGGLVFRELERAVLLDAQQRRDLHARLIRFRGRVEELESRLSPQRTHKDESLPGDAPRGRGSRRTAPQPTLDAIWRDSVARSGAERDGLGSARKSRED